jgi:hypothetical protein
MKICVHTSLSQRKEECPRVFYVGGHRLIVAGILDRWAEAPYRYFEVCVEDGRRFLLRQDEATHDWELAAVYGARFGAPKKPVAPRPAVAAAPAPRKRWWPVLR